MGGFGLDILSNLASGKPTIPAFTPVDLGQSQTKAIGSNLSSLDQIEKLGSAVTSFNTDQLTSMLKQVIPGYEDMTTQAGKNINDLLSGRIPQDVSDAVQNSDAARSLTGGYSGSGMHGNLLARDLGLTSLDLTGKGLSSAESWISRIGSMFQAGQFNLSSMFITPQQQFESSVEERNAQFQHDYVSNMNDWQHSFGVALGNDIMNTGNFFLSAVGALYGGGAKPSNVGSDSGGGGGGGGGGDTSIGTGMDVGAGY